MRLRSSGGHLRVTALVILSMALLVAVFGLWALQKPIGESLVSPALDVERAIQPACLQPPSSAVDGFDGCCRSQPTASGSVDLDAMAVERRPARSDVRSVGGVPAQIPGGPWVDAASIWPTMFDPTEIVDGRIEAYATHPATPYPGPGVVGHYLIARDMGMSDDFEVSLRWLVSGGFSFVHQVSPVAFVDLNSVDPLQMGVLPIWDVGINATYLQNAFRNEPIEDVCNSSYYTLLGGGEGGTPVEDVNEITLRSGS